MAGCTKRNRKEITLIYERNVDTVYKICFTFMKNKTDAEDCVQNTFIRLIKNSPSFESREHEKAWLIVTSSNICRDELKKKGRYSESLEEIEETVASPCENIGQSELLSNILNLPLKYRNVIYLYYYEGYSAEEIAKMQHRPSSTVRNYLHEARNILKTDLEA